MILGSNPHGMGDSIDFVTNGVELYILGQVECKYTV